MLFEEYLREVNREKQNEKLELEDIKRKLALLKRLIKMV
jgi:hypothetical protein